MTNERKYWKGIEELQQTESFQKSKSLEFPEQNNLESMLADDELNESSTGRRDFLKFLGFSVVAATVAACEAPVISSTLCHEAREYRSWYGDLVCIDLL